MLAFTVSSVTTLPAALYNGPKDIFVAGRALKPLERLVNCGVKMIGTVANEHCAVRVVTDELGNIRRVRFCFLYLQKFIHIADIGMDIEALSKPPFAPPPS